MMIINESLVEQNNRKVKTRNIFLIYVFILVAILLAISCLNYTGYYVVVVDGSSMENTLQDGDKLVARTTTDINYGDIIIVRIDSYNSSTGAITSRRLIKRVIGLAGDTIKLDLDTQGRYRVYRKGALDADYVLLDEPYAVGETFPFIGMSTRWVIGENEVFFLGDNREHSGDSRYSEYGVQSITQVEGVICNWSVSLRGLNNTLLFWMKEGA